VQNDGFMEKGPHYGPDPTLVDLKFVTNSLKGKIMRENARRELVTSSPLNATLACLLFAIFGIIHAYRSRCVYSSR